jgi:hypothetical protein
VDSAMRVGKQAHPSHLGEDPGHQVAVLGLAGVLHGDEETPETRAVQRCDCLDVGLHEAALQLVGLDEIAEVGHLHQPAHDRQHRGVLADHALATPLRTRVHAKLELEILAHTSINAGWKKSIAGICKGSTPCAEHTENLMRSSWCQLEYAKKTSECWRC